MEGLERESRQCLSFFVHGVGVGTTCGTVVAWLMAYHWKGVLDDGDKVQIVHTHDVVMYSILGFMSFCFALKAKLDVRWAIIGSVNIRESLFKMQCAWMLITFFWLLAYMVDLLFMIDLLFAYGYRVLEILVTWKFLELCGRPDLGDD